MYKENVISPYTSWEGPPLTLCLRKKYVFRKKMPSFQIIQKRSCAGMALFGKSIFSESLKKASYFRVFFLGRSSFVFCLRYKIIFLGKRNILFPDNTRKIIFQSNFLERLSFQNVWKKKIWFSVQCRGPKLVYKEGVEALSNYKKQYWWFGDPACCDPSFSSRNEKDQAHAPPRHVWGKKEEGEVWFSVCEVPLDD